MSTATTYDYTTYAAPVLQFLSATVSGCCKGTCSYWLKFTFLQSLIWPMLIDSMKNMAGSSGSGGSGDRSITPASDSTAAAILTYFSFPGAPDSVSAAFIVMALFWSRERRIGEVALVLT